MTTPTAGPPPRLRRLFAVVGLLLLAVVIDRGFLADPPDAPRPSKPAPRRSPSPTPAPPAPPAVAATAPSTAVPPPPAAVSVAPAAVSVAPAAVSVAPAAALPPPDTETLRQRLRAVGSAALSKEAIRLRYGQLAGDYAERMARLLVFHPPGSDPTKEIDAALRAVGKETGVEISGLAVGQPQPVAPGVRRARASLSLRGGDRAVLSFLWLLGDPAGGSAWETFDIAGDEKAKQVVATGELTLVAVEAAE